MSQTEKNPEMPKLPVKHRRPRVFGKFVQKYGTPLAILVGFGFVAASIYVSFGLPDQKPAPVAETSGSDAQVGGAISVSADDDPYLGAADAPVTMIEFSDFQCPYCRQFWRETLPLIKKDFIDTGKLKFVYRDFPLTNIHPAAAPTAEAANCARDEGKFWEMHDKVFAAQDKQGEGTVQYALADVEKWSAEIGLDPASFAACVDGGKYVSEVENDLRDGIVAGVNGTPSFFINGTNITGAQPYQVFEAAINNALAD